MNARTRTFGIIMLLAGVLLTSTQARADRLRKLKVGDDFPAFTMQKLGGGMISSEDYKGKVLIIVFLSAEQHSSEQAAVDAADVMTKLDNDDVRLLYASADLIYSSYFKTFFEESKLQAPLGFDTDRELYGKIGLIVLPTTVIIGRDGKLNHVISIWKSDYAQVLDVYALHTLGMIEEGEMESSIAERVYNKSTPRSRASRHRAVARLLREKGLFDNAERELRAALELDPDNLNTQLDLASLLLAAERYEDATGIVDMVLQVEPDQRRAKLLHGIILFHQGKLDEAEPLFQELLVLNPDPARTHFYLGRIYEQRGDAEKALHHYREALVRYVGEEAD